MRTTPPTKIAGALPAQHRSRLMGVAQEVNRDAVLAGLAPPVHLQASVKDGVVTLRGSLRDRALVPLMARAVRAVEGVVDVRMELEGQPTGAA
ncbi:BON domain-containing protein [Streptomyces sp. NPDC001552]|uniref:BON domain-containing protein n=1 Tax=Streptomyces sp. NPDC001552 TaxID=3364587 RepID=UPI00368F8653